MTDYAKYFKGKKITVMGLGLLGKRLGDIAFLSECGAKVLVTDLKTKEELAPSIQKLKKYKNITYSLGGHKFEDFENCDIVLKGQGVPLDSPYLARAREKGIPIEMDESWFVKIAREMKLYIKVVGITGTRGKSTTTILIYEILRGAGLPVHLGGNIKGTAALPLLKKIKQGDIVVFELSSWQLQGFGDAKISPDIAVFTNFMPDHMNYYDNDLKKYFKDKAYIYKFQKKDDHLILGSSMRNKVDKVKSQVTYAASKNVPGSWQIPLPGEHNKENIACAIAVARILNIPKKKIKKAVENIKPVPGRLEKVRTLRGIDIYNDTNATTPEATLVALRAFKKPVILILGGSDKGLELAELKQAILKKAKQVILLPGTGSDRLMTKDKFPMTKVKNLQDAVTEAVGQADKGDIILFSPAFASFGMFKNEYDRGDKFMKIIKRLQ